MTSVSQSMWLTHYHLVFRYCILAADAVPAGFVDGKQVTEKILSALQMDPNDYKIGNTKVFFKAGVLGNLEDMRDERLSRIVALFQAWIRGYNMKKQYKRLEDQRYATQKSTGIFQTVFFLYNSIRIQYALV